MDDKDHVSKAFDLLDFIHRYVRENGIGPTKSEILRETEIDKEKFQNIFDADYIEKDGSKLDSESDESGELPAFNLTSNGAAFLRNSQLNENLSKSIRQQKISSTSETFFTIAILLGAWIQASIAIFSNLPSNKIFFRGICLPFSLSSFLVALITVIFGIIGLTALQLNWSDLKEVVKENTFWRYFFS